MIYQFKNSYYGVVGNCYYKHSKMGDKLRPEMIYDIIVDRANNIVLIKWLPLSSHPDRYKNFPINAFGRYISFCKYDSAYVERIKSLDELINLRFIKRLNNEIRDIRDYEHMISSDISENIKRDYYHLVLERILNNGYIFKVNSTDWKNDSESLIPRTKDEALYLLNAVSKYETLKEFHEAEYPEYKYSTIYLALHKVEQILWKDEPNFEVKSALIKLRDIDR